MSSERELIISYIKQFDCEEDWNLARGLIADIEAGKHLTDERQRIEAQVAILRETEQRTYTERQQLMKRLDEIEEAEIEAKEGK